MSKLIKQSIAFTLSLNITLILVFLFINIFCYLDKQGFFIIIFLAILIIFIYVCMQYLSNIIYNFISLKDIVRQNQLINHSLYIIKNIDNYIYVNKEIPLKLNYIIKELYFFIVSIKKQKKISLKVIKENNIYLLIKIQQINKFIIKENIIIKPKLKLIINYMLLLAFIVFIRFFIISAYTIPSGSMIPTLLIGDHILASNLMYGLKHPIKDKYLLRWGTPKSGDIIIFSGPIEIKNNNYQWIKRVLAIEEENIKIINGLIYVNNIIFEQSNMKKLNYYNYCNIYKNKKWFYNKGIIAQENINGIIHKIIKIPNVKTLFFMREWPLIKMKSLKGLSCNINICKIKKNYVFVLGDNRGGSADSRTWGGVNINTISGKAILIWLSIDTSQQLLKNKFIKIHNFRWERFFNKIY